MLRTLRPTNVYAQFLHVGYSSSASDSPLSLPDPLVDPVESGMTTSFRYVTYNVISQWVRVSYCSGHNYSRGDGVVQSGVQNPISIRD
jgi:hypothetical protein